MQAIGVEQGIDQISQCLSARAGTGPERAGGVIGNIVTTVNKVGARAFQTGPCACEDRVGDGSSRSSSCGIEADRAALSGTRKVAGKSIVGEMNRGARGSEYRAASVGQATFIGES